MHKLLNCFQIYYIGLPRGYSHKIFSKPEVPFERKGAVSHNLDRLPWKNSTIKGKRKDGEKRFSCPNYLI